MGTANIEAFADAFIGFDKTLYVEHSNEVWNSDFSQYHYAATQVGTYTGPGDAQNIQAWHADRTDEIGEIFKSRLPGLAVKIVWGCQNDNPFFIQNSLSYCKRPLTYIDATATAPYIGQRWANTQTVASLAALTDQQVADAVLNDFNVNVAPKVATWKSEADLRGWEYYAYEGGTSLATSDGTLADAFEARLATPEFQAVYEAYLDYWVETTGGSLFLLYRDVGRDVFGHIEAEKLAGQPRWDTFVNRMSTQ